MQSRYAAQPGTQMSAEMTWGGQRAQNKCSIRMRKLDTARDSRSYQYTRYQISITCSRTKFRSRVTKGQIQYPSTMLLL